MEYMYVIGIERVCYLFIVYDDDDVKPYISPERGPQQEVLAEVKPLFQKKGQPRTERAIPAKI